MTSTTASTPPDMSERSDREIPRWQLHVLHAIALLLVVRGLNNTHAKSAEVTWT